jgi:prophage antirepressor-like protein
VNVVPFQFDGAAVRVQVSAAGDPWFNAADVCAALGFGNHRQAIDSHVDSDDVQKLDATDSLGRSQPTNHINESGVYALIFGSTKPVARKFRRWITTEVLPQIRRTGSYSAAPVVPQTLAQALRLAADQAEQLERQAALIAEQSADVEALKRLANTDGLLTPRDAAKAIGVGPTALNRWLDAHGWTYVQGGRRHAYQRRIESGDLVQKVHEVGPPEDRKSVAQVYVTMAGAAKLAKRVKP